MEVLRSDMADEGQVLADAEDERHRSRPMQLRLHEVAVELLKLVDTSDGIKMCAAWLLRILLQLVQVGLRHHGRGEGIREDLTFELVDLRERQVRTLQGRLEGVVQRHERRDGEVD